MNVKKFNNKLICVLNLLYCIINFVYKYNKNPRKMNFIKNVSYYNSKLGKLFKNNYFFSYFYNLVDRNFFNND